MEALNEIVRLSLGEGQRTLNVLSAGKDGNNLSVVCPFPVLPVELPVSVTLPGEGAETTTAILRAVKVEMSEDTDLPRFKLQIELDSGAAETTGSSDQTGAPDGVSIELDEFGSEPGSATEAAKLVVVEAQAEEPEAAEPHEQDEIDGHEAWARGFETGIVGFEDGEEEHDDDFEDDHDLDCSSDDEGDSTTDEMDEIDEFNWPPPPEYEEEDEDFEEEGEGPTEDDEEAILGIDQDPPWAVSGFEQEKIAEEPEPRGRAKWPVRVAVTLALVVSLVAVGYVMRHQIMDLATPIMEGEVTLASLGVDFGSGGSTARPATPTSPTPASIPSPATTEDDAVDADDEEPAPAPALAEDDEAEAGNDEETDGESAPEEEATAPDPTVEDSGERLRVTLPTQWPVSEARSYRLHDPTGIVVDVPGGLASRAARWIDTSHDRVRSVRVLEREEGVRFIIYLNDEAVPRYRVGYGRTGVTVDIMGPDPRHATRGSGPTPSPIG